MTSKFTHQALALMLLAGTTFVSTSCIREALPDIGVDITDLQPSVSGTGIVKTTIQENGVTVYADYEYPNFNIKSLPLTISVTNGATYEYVDVEFKTTTTYYDYQGMKVPMTSTDTIITAHSGQQTDFSQTRYVKVMAEAEGLNEDDQKTRANFSKFGGIDAATGRLFKIWSIQVLPANIPTKLSFNTWYHPYGRKYMHPYETVSLDNGRKEQLNIWASTNNSLGILLSTLYGASLNESVYGTCPTTDSRTGLAGDSALLLQTKDIHLYDTNKPFVAGCMFIGEFDGTDNDALTCTHVGLPFNKKPLKFKFDYKFIPGVIDSNIKSDYSEYVGQNDQGFIKAVLFRTDDKVQYLTGRTIRDNSYANTIAYAEFFPNKATNGYEPMELDFNYVGSFSEQEMKDWKYGLAIYFASSKNGFVFVGSGNTKLYIDNVEVVCE